MPVVFFYKDRVIVALAVLIDLAVRKFLGVSCNFTLVMF